MPIKSWFIKNIYFLGILFVLVIIAVILNSYSSKTVPQTTVTVPKIEVTPSQSLPSNYTQSFKDISQIKITDSGRVLSVNKDHRLVLNTDGREIFISPEGSNVVNYEPTGDLVVYEVGIYANSNNQFYLFDLVDSQFTPLNLSSVAPVISYSLNSDKNTLALLGQYRSKGFTSNLITYKINSNQTTVILKNVSANYVKWIDEDAVILGKSLDKNEPNYWISLYSTVNQKYLLQEYPVVKKSLSFDTSGKNLFFINSQNSTLESFSLENMQTYQIAPVDSLNLETIYYPKTNTIITLESFTDSLTLNFFDPVAKKLLINKKVNLFPQETYIEKYLNGDNLFIKTYNQNTKEYQIRAITF
ncbi:MAG TPA: hypothetical protein PLI45_03300 [Candidatus Woesebacteria bacterium]|nr:hypothetical protein [Candidatus Woesebacteria bacterium]